MVLDGQRIVVFGLAASGRAAARLAVEQGAVLVIGVDQKLGLEPISGVRLELGPSHLETFRSADLVVVSPGIPAHAPELLAAQEAGVAILGELSFAARFLSVPMVAISGTNGKSTVTWFTGQLLGASGFRTFIGGNFGRPLSEAAFAENAGQFDVAVVEVSSYQMEWKDPGFRPHAAAILNLTPDHLARHGTMEAYGALKCRMFETMGPEDVAFVPEADPLLARLAERVGGGERAWIGGLPGVVRSGHRVAVRFQELNAVFDLSGFDIPGEHNLDNAALAAALSLATGADPYRVQSAISGLRPLAHRMEVVSKRGGITWINDSKATNVAATAVGVRGLQGGGVLLLGGQAKGDAFAELVPLLGEWRVITFGGSGEAIADELCQLGVSVERAGNLADAVQRSRTLAQVGDRVLLSPGCASFDEFRNFEHRGQTFRELTEGVNP